MRALVEFHSSMGGFIVELPILHALRDSGRLEAVEVVVHTPCDALLGNYGWIDRVHVRDRGPGGRFGPVLRSLGRPFGLRLYLRQSSRNDPGAWFVRARRTLGVDRFDPAMKDRGVVIHKLSILRSVLGEAMPSGPRVRIDLRPDCTGSAFRKAGLRRDARILSIGPGAGRPHKRWPEQRFVQLIDALAPAFDCVVVVGSPAEQPLCDRIAARTGALGLAGRLEVTQTAAVLGEASLHLGNDSALAHLAAAQGCPTVAIGPKYAYFTPWQGYAVRGEVAEVGVATVVSFVRERGLAPGH